MKVPKQFQLIILPKGDICHPSGLFVCCPFTGIFGEGPTYEKALTMWKENARKSYNVSFPIPASNKFCTRKVWYSTDKTTSHSIFLLDFSSDVHLDPVVVIPSSHEMKGKSEHELGAMFDWKVFCSPITKIIEPQRINQPILSLTPNCIN